MGRRGAVRWVLLAIATTASALVVSLDGLRDDWFSDEMWRVAMLRSPHWWSLYLSWDTPTPPGFLWVFRVLDGIGPSGPAAFRAWTTVAIVTALLLIAWLFDSIASKPLASQRWDAGGRLRSVPSDRLRARRWSVLVASAATPLLATPGIHRIFVPYPMEAALGAALLVALFSLETRPRAVWALCGLIVVLPFVAIGTMFLLPATCVAAFLILRRDDAPRGRIAALVAASTIGALTFLVMQRVAYEPVHRDTISGFWRHDVLDSPADLPSLLARTYATLTESVLQWSVLGSGWFAGVLVIAGLVVGALSLGRRWPTLVWVIGVSWLSLPFVSLVAGWPMTPRRVNLAVFLPVFVLVLYGWMRSLAALARDLWPAVVVAAGVVLLAVWPVHQEPLPNGAFLRGMTDDLAVPARSDAQENLVFTYHFATRWYAEDALVTDRPGGHDFTVVPETYDDMSVYDPDVVRSRIDGLPAGSMVWCVIAYDVGPEAAERACPVPDGLTEVVDVRGERSIIRGYRTG